jgi:hypothetical protein
MTMVVEGKNGQTHRPISSVACILTSPVAAPLADLNAIPSPAPGTTNAEADLIAPAKIKVTNAKVALLDVTVKYICIFITSIKANPPTTHTCVGRLRWWWGEILKFFPSEGENPESEGRPTCCVVHKPQGRDLWDGSTSWL